MVIENWTHDEDGDVKDEGEIVYKIEIESQLQVKREIAIIMYLNI